MKIAIVTDKSREKLVPLVEAQAEDNQKMETVMAIKEILSKKYEIFEFPAGWKYFTTLLRKR